MAYCIQSDIEKRLTADILIEMTDDDAIGVVDTDNLDAAIADADEEIDAYLSIRYSLPFETVPLMVKRMSADLTVCMLYGRRDHLEIPKSWADRCDAHRRMLDRLARGELRLDVPEPPTDSDDGIAVSGSRDDRTFTLGRSSDGTSGTLDNY